MKCDVCGDSYSWETGARLTTKRNGVKIEIALCRPCGLMVETIPVEDVEAIAYDVAERKK